MSELPAQVRESAIAICRKTKEDPEELAGSVVEEIARLGRPPMVEDYHGALFAICEKRGFGSVAREFVHVRGEDTARLHTDAPMRAEAGGTLFVPVRFDLSGRAVETVTLAPETKHLVVKVEHGPRAGLNVIVSTSFDGLRRVNDQRGVAWLDLPHGGDDGGPLRATIPEFIAAIRKRFPLSGQGASALGAYVNALPVSEVVSSRLELRAPAQPGETWGVPPVFSRQMDGRSDAAGVLSRWYRPRPREVAMALHETHSKYATSSKLRAINCMVAGAPVFRAIAPERQYPRLDLRGMSGAGKTNYTLGAIAVYWGLGGGPHELLSGDTITSGFRRSDFLSASDLPVLVDETHLTRREREEMRAAAGGATTTRGGTDLLHRAYGLGAFMVTTANDSGDESDSSLSAKRADDRRRLRVTFTQKDIVGIAERKEEYDRFLRTLTTGEQDPSGGGAALWLLRDAHAADPKLSAFCEIARTEPSEVNAILRIGALLLRVNAPRFDLSTEDDAASDFLEFIRGEVVELLGLKEGDHRSPVYSRIRAVDAGGLDVYGSAEKVRSVYVSLGEIREYSRRRAAARKDSAYSKLADLVSLCAVTGQSEEEMVGKPEPNRPARGISKSLAGTTTRVAIVKMPSAEPDAPPKSRTLDSEED